MHYLILTLVVASNVPSAEALIDAYVRSTEIFASAEVSVRFRETYTGPTRLDGIVVREGDYLVRRSGDRWKVEFAGTSRSLDENSRLAEHAQRYEIVLGSGGEYTHVNRDGPTDSVRLVIARLSGAPQHEVASLDYFTVLSGVFGGNGGTDFVDVLRRSDASVVDDAGRWRLECSSKFGVATIWFEPTRNMAVSRLRFSKSENDLINETRVGDLSAQQADSFHPAGKIASFENGFEVHEFRELGGLTYPSSVTINSITRYASGQEVQSEYKAQLRITRGSGLSSTDFKISSPIPDGFAVQVSDHPNIEYEWRNGRIVKAISAEARANLLTSRFGSNFSIAAYFLTFAALLLVATALFVWHFRRRENQT